MKLISVLIFLLIISTRIKAQETYSITDLGTLNPTGINDSGQVSGYQIIGVNVVAVRWEKGIFTNFPNPDGTTIATGINNLGVMSGDYSSPEGTRAVIFRNDSMHILPSPGRSRATGINDFGYVVGQVKFCDTCDNAAIWKGGDPIDLGSFSRYGSNATDINNSSLVVGYGEAPPTFNEHAFKTTNGPLIDLGTLGGNTAEANAINQLGHIVGSSRDASGNDHAVIWKPGIFSLQNPGSFGAEAYDINDFDIVVGESSGGRAFVWNDGVMKDLNTLCDTSGGWVIQNAIAINNLGQIVGTGSLNGQQRGFLLTLKPRYPVFIVPGVGATYSANLENDLGWILKRGIEPDSLQIDPLGRVYDDLIITLENLGYVKGKDLFIANYDWRVIPGPVDNNIDGHIDGVSGTSITSGQFNFGVDYLGWFIKQACERWRQDHNEELDSIDIISHSTGGLVTRTYIQSDAYGGVYDNVNNYLLPKIRNFIMIGVPNRGASKPWNPIHDNWTGDIAYRLVLSKIVNSAYQKVLQDKIVTGPDGNITKNTILDSTGTPNKELFINKYVPTIRYLLATYPFIDFGGGLTTVNNDVDQRNTILLDLNNGFDINPLNDPNGFLDSAKVTVIYGTNVTTKSWVTQRSDFETFALQSFTEFTPSTAFPGNIWYKDVEFESNGDGTVQINSSAGQFLIDTRANMIPFATGDHTGLVSQQNVQESILDILDVPYNISNISSGHSTNYDAVLSVVLDPVELVITDGNGNRFGYTNTSGALTEIPNSLWFGNTDGRGWVFGSVTEPINLQLTGLGENYYVMVSVEDSGKYGGVVLEGFLASGEVINYQITLDPVSVKEISSVIPQNFALAQNYPNPFNPTTKINWQSPVGSHQTLKIYDILGNEVATLVDEYREAGRYEITFNASHLASGVYFYKLQAGSFIETKKMILLR